MASTTSLQRGGAPDGASAIPDGTTIDLGGAVGVTKDVDTGSASCIDEGGNVLAIYPRGELLAFSYTPFPLELIEALQNPVTSNGASHPDTLIKSRD